MSVTSSCGDSLSLSSCTVQFKFALNALMLTRKTKMVKWWIWKTLNLLNIIMLALSKTWGCDHAHINIFFYKGLEPASSNSWEKLKIQKCVYVTDCVCLCVRMCSAEVKIYVWHHFSICVFTLCVRGGLRYLRNINLSLMNTIRGARCAHQQPAKCSKALQKNSRCKSKLISSSAAFLGIGWAHHNAAALEDSVITSCYLAKLGSRSSPEQWWHD